MRTYIRVMFNTEGASPAKVVKTMKALGFEESLGMHDFVYRWPKDASVGDVVMLVDRMHGKLKGLKLGYEVTTVA